MWKTIFNRKVAIDILLFALVFAGLGIIYGIIVSSYQETVHSLIDPTQYQNFGLYTGAIVGLLTGIIIYICYLLLTRSILHREWFSFRLFLLFSGVAGAVISLVTYYLLVSSATSYGMVERTGSIIMIDAIISAVLGGGVGILFGIALAKIRNFAKG